MLNSVFGCNAINVSPLATGQSEPHFKLHITGHIQKCRHFN